MRTVTATRYVTPLREGGSLPGLVEADASRVLWFDALVENADRSWRNPNLLRWHGALWLIDHGATLYFHHAWARAGTVVERPYDARDHVLAPFAQRLADADRALAPLVTAELLAEVAALVPGGLARRRGRLRRAGRRTPGLGRPPAGPVCGPRAWLPEVPHGR